MAGINLKRRSGDASQPPKKRKRQAVYKSDSEPEEAQDFEAFNLADSDGEDLANAIVDDGADSAEENSTSGSDSDGDVESRLKTKPASKKASKPSAKNTQSKANKIPTSDDDNALEGDAEDEDDESNDEYDVDGDSEDEAQGSDVEAGRSNSQKHKSKRNDPTAFANSLSKILNTKLSTSRRADPVLARSADARKTAQTAIDNALEARAHRHLREQKRLALEKGRVRDVLVATNDASGALDEVDGQGRPKKSKTTGEVLAEERRLRKVAQRGVVKLFNAVRAAQVKATETERMVRKEHVIGMGRREEKVHEMSKKGFLDLIASGGALKQQGPIEEA